MATSDPTSAPHTAPPRHGRGRTMDTATPTQRLPRGHGVTSSGEVTASIPRGDHGHGTAVTTAVMMAMMVTITMR